jgi:cytochrome c
VVNTVASLADKGVNIYNTACARCHGGSGQGGIGPPLMSDSANLSKYGTAQALFSFIKNSMPFSAPGSLPENEYHQVTAYLIMKNNLLPGDQKFEPADLANISLAK